MRILRHLSFLFFIAGVAWMVFNDQGQINTQSDFVTNPVDPSHPDKIDISFVGTLKTLMKLKQLKKKTEEELLSDCGDDCPVRTKSVSPDNQTWVPPFGATVKEEKRIERTLASLEPEVLIHYQPPLEGPQVAHLQGENKHLFAEVTLNSLLNFQIQTDHDSLIQCTYTPPKSVSQDCSRWFLVKTIRTVENEDIGQHRFQLVSTSGEYSYVFEVVKIK